jgi:hypothetical protein
MGRKYKTLSFRLTPEEYAKFWKIGALLSLTEKHEIFRKMLQVIEEMYSNEK